MNQITTQNRFDRDWTDNRVCCNCGRMARVSDGMYGYCGYHNDMDEVTIPLGNHTHEVEN